MTRVDWWADAACAGLPGLPWTTDTDDLHRVPDVVVDTMLASCEACAVRAACEQYATEAVVTGGWWAGIDRDPVARLWARVEWEPVRARDGRLLAEQALLPTPPTDWQAA